MITITVHACQRFIERIDRAASLDQARAEILSHERAIIKAADFGCRVVKLGCGGRLLLRGATVVSVLSREQGRDREMMARPAYSIVGRI